MMGFVAAEVEHAISSKGPKDILFSKTSSSRGLGILHRHGQFRAIDAYTSVADVTSDRETFSSGE